MQKFLLILSLSVLALGPAAAQTSPASRVGAALERAGQADAPTDWQFTISLAHADGAVVGRYDGSLPQQSQWQMLTPAPAEASEAQQALWDSVSDPVGGVYAETGGLFFSDAERDAIAGPFSLLETSGSAEHYAFVPLVEMSIGSSDALAPHLRGEMHLSGTDPYVSEIRVYAPASFKPHFAVRIDELEMIKTYQIVEAAPQPVLVRYRQTTRGAALFQSFDDSLDIEISDITYLGNAR